MTRRPSQSIMANPVLVGAVTVLIVTVAVFLAYNAHKGLPFVPMYQLRVQLPNAEKLLPGNDVREGGHRIGLVESIRPVRLPGGRGGAEVVIRVERKAWTMPRDTTVSVRGRSVLGLKYLDIRRGSSEVALPEYGVIAASGAQLSEDLDRFLGIYDEATRAGAQRSLEGFGSALTGRGDELNRAIAVAPPLLRNLEVVTDLLARRETRLPRFITELGDVARAIRPVADRYAHSFTTGADTFAALSADPRALDATIAGAPPALQTGTTSFRAQRALLRETGRLSASLDATARRLPATLPRLTRLATTGGSALPAGSRVNERLVPLLARLRELATDPATSSALTAATATNATLGPLTRFVGPYITVCNYFNYAFGQAADTASEPDLTGLSGRSLVVVAGRQDNSMGSIGAAEPANGQNVQTGVGGFLHQNLYSAAIDREGNADCESGQRGFLNRLNTFGDPRFRTVVDPHIPGNQGPTFTGRPRVPAGQTFSRAPELGPTMPAELDP